VEISKTITEKLEEMVMIWLR